MSLLNENHEKPPQITQGPDPGVYDRVDRAAEEALEEMSKRLVPALEVIDDVLAGAGTMRDRITTAFGIYDRVGANRTKQLELEAAKEKGQTQVVHVHITDETAERFINATSKRFVRAERNVTPIEGGGEIGK